MPSKYLFMLIAVGFGASALFSQYLNPKVQSTQVIECQTPQRCSWDFAQHDYVLELPEQLLSMQTQTLSITTSAPSPNLSIKLEGKNMYMGELSYAFKASGNNQYTAEILIPACSEAVMLWTASIENSNAKQWPGFSFEVESR